MVDLRPEEMILLAVTARVLLASIMTRKLDGRERKKGLLCFCLSQMMGGL